MDDLDCSSSLCLPSTVIPDVFAVPWVTNMLAFVVRVATEQYLSQTGDLFFLD